RKISFRSSVSCSTSFSCSSYASPLAIAFWKIVGFVVTPTTASSVIRRFSSPSSSMVRERESIHTLWPRALSLSRFESAILHLPFLRFHLLQTRRVAVLVQVPRAEERAHELSGHARADHLAAQT